jgi:galactokinase
MVDAAERALTAAKRAWGDDWEPDFVSRAPGRLELLGNHIDYNGGPVLAAAIDRDAVCLVRSTTTGGLTVLFADFDSAPIKLDPNQLRDWRSTATAIEPVDYAHGVIAAGLVRDGSIRSGLVISVAGDVPIGFGLSSSAALCVALTLAMHIDPPAGRDLVLRAQEAEHRAGSPCGTMDQSASVGGNVILFDGASVSWTSIEPNLGDYVFAVADSGVNRSLGASSYPRRVEESKEALRIANEQLGVEHESLSRLTMAALSSLQGRLPETLFRRARHVVTETQRVRDGEEAMRAGNWPRFGELMTESGRSSAGDYEISHPRVERIVEIALAVDGVAGARMMGGGEGGMALILAKQQSIKGLTDALQRDYYSEFPAAQDQPVRVFQFAPGATTNRARD